MTQENIVEKLKPQNSRKSYNEILPPPPPPPSLSIGFDTSPMDNGKVYKPFFFFTTIKRIMFNVCTIVFLFQQLLPERRKKCQDVTFPDFSPLLKMKFLWMKTLREKEKRNTVVILQWNIMLDG